MQIKKYAVFLVIISLFLVGCGQKAPTNVPQGPYKFPGVTMLEAKFVPDAPVTLDTDPYTPTDTIEVAVELANKLPEDIPAGKVKIRLTGDAAIPNFFTGAKEMTNPELHAIDLTTGVTEPEEVQLGPLKYVGDLPGKASKQITGEVCYEYPVKVKAFLYYTNKQGEIGLNLPPTGHPPSRVKIISMEQQAVNVRDGQATLRFKLNIKNEGTGMLVDNLDQCFKFRERSEREKLTIQAAGAYPITCENGGEVLLSRDTRNKLVDCTVTGINPNQLGPEPSEVSLTLSGFAYQEDLTPITLWLEP